MFDFFFCPPLHIFKDLFPLGGGKDDVEQTFLRCECSCSVFSHSSLSLYGCTWKSFSGATNIVQACCIVDLRPFHSTAPITVFKRNIYYSIFRLRTQQANSPGRCKHSKFSSDQQKCQMPALANEFITNCNHTILS